jgi:hypothetical protein
MVAPTSALLAEICLQNVEHNKIISVLKQHKIIEEATEIIYDEQITDMNRTVAEFI